MTNIRNKQRPFRMLKYLYENTDENHPVSTPELVKIFQAEDAHASRKTIKDDIDVLIGEGFDIVTVRSTQNSFFLANRKFEIPEIKLLIDAVSSSRFINREKSAVLIEKLTGMVTGGEDPPPPLHGGPGQGGQPSDLLYCGRGYRCYQ